MSNLITTNKKTNMPLMMIFSIKIKFEKKNVFLKVLKKNSFKRLIFKVKIFVIKMFKIFHTQKRQLLLLVLRVMNIEDQLIKLTTQIIITILMNKVKEDKTLIIRLVS